MTEPDRLPNYQIVTLAVAQLGGAALGLRQQSRAIRGGSGDQQKRRAEKAGPASPARLVGRHAITRTMARARVVGCGRPW